jgi:Ca2+-binding RTX toxin-like protein
MRSKGSATRSARITMLFSVVLFAWASLPAHAGAAGLTFSPQVQYTTGTASGPQGIAAGDLNNDNKLDLVTADGANKISPLTGNGDGTFAPLTPLTFAGLNNPAWIVVTDLNNDTNADLVVPNFGASSDGTTITSLYGTGAFGFNHVNLNVGGTAPESVVAGDLSSDGSVDLAVAVSGSDTAAIFKNDGSGNLALQPGVTTGDGPISIATGDLNKDGKLDLATANFNASTASVLLGNGDGTFGAKNDFPTGTSPAGIAVADFNRDGRPDIATSDFDASKVSVLLGNGNGTFGAKTDFDTGTHPAGIAVGDLNSDRRPDVVTANSGANTLSVLVGNGDGTLKPKTDLATGTYPLTPAIVDPNSDGRPDLAVTNFLSDNVSVRLNTSQPAAAIAPASLSFGSQTINATSPVKSFAVINNGAAPLHINRLDIVGAQGADFDIARDRCTGTTLDAAAACAVGVTFTPSAKGTRTATVKVSDDASDSPQFASLAGTGAVPTCHGLNATIVGGPGDDTLTGTAGNDIVSLLGGQDTFHGAAGNDTVCGGPGDDELVGQDGNDKVYGGSDDDYLSGGKNTDTCGGGSGEDSTDLSCETKTSIP